MALFFFLMVAGWMVYLALPGFSELVPVALTLIWAMSAEYRFTLHRRALLEILRGVRIPPRYHD